MEERQDLINRQAAIDEIEERKNANGYRNVAVISELNRLEGYIMRLPSAQPVDKDIDVPSTDTISRQAAIDAFKKACTIDEVDRNGIKHGEIRTALTFEGIMKMLNNLPSAKPEIKPIGYQDCANAMLRMWMDKVVTDGEYNRIMDKLNAFWGTRNERSD